MEERAQAVMRGLAKVWADFTVAVDATPLIDKLNRGKFRLDDYKALLVNHRQQVIEGSRWIARAASSVTSEFAEQRSAFLRHAVTEHRDYRMIEEDFVAVGGSPEEIVSAEKNIGSEALHAFMYQRASERNPFDLIGAMFIIEGLGRHKAPEWGRRIQAQLSLRDDQVRFLLYHGANDASHIAEMENVLQSGVLAIPDLDRQIVRTARIVARLYRLQIEELGNV